MYWTRRVWSSLQSFLLVNTRQNTPQLSKFFIRADDSTTSGHNWKLEKTSIRCDSRLHFFSVNRWNNLSQEAVDAPSINLFKNLLERRRLRKMDFLWTNLVHLSYGMTVKLHGTSTDLDDKVQSPRKSHLVSYTSNEWPFEHLATAKMLFKCLLLRLRQTNFIAEGRRRWTTTTWVTSVHATAVFHALSWHTLLLIILSSLWCHPSNVF